MLPPVKRIFLVALLLGLATSAFSQVLWEKTWGGPYDDGCEVRNTRDGGMIAMAYYGVDPWLMRLDSNGDTLWTRRISHPIDLCAVTETLDGGFLATGLTRTQHRDLLAWKFDDRGDSVWMRTYVDTLYNEGMYTVLAEADSSFLITGYTSANGYDMLALHIDSLGNTIWQHAYGSPDFEGGTMAAATADGGYILATTASGTSAPHIWVVKIDGAGDTLWTRNHVEPYPTGGAVPTVTAQGDILIMGWIQRTDYDNYLLCLDSAGNRRWAQAYPGIGFESRTARGVIQDRFGGYTFASSVDHAYGPSGADHDIALFRLDSLGAVQQIHRIGRQGDDMPRYFEQAADGDYLFIGYTNSFVPNNQQLYFARLHPGGCGTFFYDLASPLRDSVCPGDTLLLDAGGGFVQYLWSDGDTTQTRAVLQTDTLYVEAIDSLGCVHYANGVSVRVFAGPQYAWSVSGNLEIQFTGMPGDGTQVRWDFGDGDTSSVADPNHVFSQAGTYVVCLQSLVPGCGWESYCDSVEVTTSIGVAQSTEALPSVYPNPASRQVLIANPTGMAAVCTLWNLQGGLVQATVVEAGETVAWDVAALGQGVYLLRMTGEGAQFLPQKLVIAR